MVDKPIPLLPLAVVPLLGDELMEIVQNGNSRSTPVNTVGLWDAPVDGLTYARNNGLWVETITKVQFDDNNAALAAALAGKVSEAPTDGQIYVRRNAAWQAQTPATLLTDIKSVDGVGSGLDADLLDGQTGSWYQDRANHTGTQAIATVLGLQAVLDTKAPLASPALTGNPTAPTPAAADNDTSIATTAFVQGEIAGKAPLASPVFTGDPRAPTPLAADNDTSIATTAYVTGAIATSDAAQNAALALKAPLANPIFTGDPQAPTPATGDNDTSIATTAFVKAQGYAPLASPALTGNPTAPTPTAGDNDTSIATTAFVTGAIATSDANQAAALTLKAPLASPVFTGDPQAPTPATADNDTSIATTAFVKAQGYVGEAPNDGQYYSRRNLAWQVSPGGLADAPNDGRQYARQSAAWVIITDVPIGTVIHVAANVAPTNFIKLNGSLLNRATYAALWAYAQASGNITASDAAWTGNEGAFSPGDGSTTFRIPDDRGVFMRNWDDGRGIDASRVLGAFQDHLVLSHNHTADVVAGHDHKITTSQPYSSGTPALSNTGTSTGGLTAASSSKLSFADGTHTPSINAAGGAENRVKNHARLACIRYQ